MFDFLNEFDHAVISGHVGAAKPDRRIFEILFERVGRQPQELLFIDDSLSNIEAARALGMPAIHFGPDIDLERELSRAWRPALRRAATVSLILHAEAALFRGGDAERLSLAR